MLIGITGKKGSGKNTVGSILDQEFGFVVTSLAMPIKKALNEIFNWDWSNWESVQKELTDVRYGVSPRQMAQFLGTEFAQFILPENFPEYGKTVGRKLWVKKLIDGLSQFEDHAISDVRYLHEVEEIKKVGGKIIKVIRPNLESIDTHPSETELDKINADVTIYNLGNVDDLRSVTVKAFYDVYP